MWQTVGKWRRGFLAALGMLGALVLLAATIAPDDITSNLARWIARLGFADFAASISDKSADIWGVAFGTIALVLVASIVAVPYLRQFFLAKESPGHVATRPGIPRYPNVKLAQSAIAAYVRGSPRVKRIDDIIAADARLPIDYSESGSLYREEMARVANITDMAMLDRLLEENEDLVIRLSHYIRVKGDRMPCGFCIDRLFEVIMAKAGLGALKKFMQSLQWSTGGTAWAEEIMAAYSEITASSPSMMSLWDAAQKLYSETVSGSVGSLARSLKTKGSPLSYYCHFIKDSVPVFGNRPPSTTREKIDFTGLDIMVESGNVVAIQQYGNERWENLAISESDFARVRNEILKTDKAT